MLLCWFGVAAMSQLLTSQHERLQAPKPVVRYQDLFLDLLGEGRTLLARLMWFQADLYHEQEDAAGVATFKQKQVIPVLRMVTYLDPNFVDAYDVIVYDLDEGFQQRLQAIELLEEGLAYNPTSYALNLRRALLAEKESDSITAFLYARRAFDSPDADSNRLILLKLLRRCAAQMRDPVSGLEVVGLLQKLGIPDPDPELSRIWRAELQGKGVKTGSGPEG